MQNKKDKIFIKQDNLYNFPYHYLPQKYSGNIFKPFRVHFWLYDYIFLINYLKKKILNFKHDKFLDFGCGDGRFINEFQKSTDNKLYGYEISEKARLFFKAFNPDSILINDFDELKKYEHFFDAVNFSEVIEHILDDNNFFENLVRSTKSGGHIIITSPHLDSYINFADKFSWSKKTSIIEDGGHVKLGYSIDEIKKFSKNFNLNLKDIYFITECDDYRAKNIASFNAGLKCYLFNIL